MPVRRRDFLVGSLAAAAGLGGVGRCLAAEIHPLEFYHIHTGEKLKVVYREQGTLIPSALQEINHFLRDFRTEQMHEIDIRLLDKLSKIYSEFDCRGNFEVISGYRSPKTNEALRHTTTGVAQHSLHLSGRAIDVRLTSAATTKLRDAAIALQSGGVGYYAHSNFVHIDTGAVRTW